LGEEIGGGNSPPASKEAAYLNQWEEKGWSSLKHKKREIPVEKKKHPEEKSVTTVNVRTVSP